MALHILSSCAGYCDQEQIVVENVLGGEIRGVAGKGREVGKH